MDGRALGDSVAGALVMLGCLAVLVGAVVGACALGLYLWLR
jgi:hypothetical protein